MSDQTNNQPVQEEPSLSELLQIRRDKLAALREQGQDPFVITRFDVTHHSDEIKGRFEEMEGQGVRLAGRMMSKRGMGKAVFSDLQDGAGRIQLYVRIDDVGEEALAAFKKYDIGDIVGVKGQVFRTQRGEMSVRVQEITLLSKSLLPLPEKFHGLTDKETRYRKGQILNVNIVSARDEGIYVSVSGKGEILIDKSELDCEEYSRETYADKIGENIDVMVLETAPKVKLSEKKVKKRGTVRSREKRSFAADRIWGNSGSSCLRWECTKLSE